MNDWYKSLKALINNKQLRETIGENAYKLSKEFVAKYKEIDWEAIEGLRHVLVHDYYTVNFETVWNIIKTDVPTLKGFLAEYVG